MDALFTFKTSIFDLIMKVEENYENDKFNYQNAIKAFIKQEKNFFKVCLVGTLNLCLKEPEKIQM